MSITRPEVVFKSVSGVSFGFFSDEEVTALAVMRITNPQTFDNMGVALKNGLYDPRMGPTDPKGSCGTCSLDYHTCPGHFGFLELPLPVYNPLVFSSLYKLIKSTCQSCFRFKMAAPEVDRFRRRILAIQAGDLLKANEIASSTDASMKSAQKILEEEGAAPVNFEGDRRAAGGPKPRAKMTTQTTHAMREVIKDFLARIPSKKCANCGAFCPGFKNEGASKLFANALSRKNEIANEKNGTPLRSALKRSEGVAEVDKELGGAVLAKERARKAQRKARADEKRVDEEDAPKEAAGDNSESDESESDGSDSEGEDAAIAMRVPHYVTPHEAHEILRELWEKEWEILSLIYQSDIDAQGDLAAMRAPAPRRKPVDSTASRALLAKKEGYKMFFVKCLPVAPNKFRPVSKMGDAIYEHPQNTLLQKSLQLCMQMVELAGPQAEGEPVDLGRSIRAYLQLQLTVNNLMDSNMTEEKNPEVNGIKQVLEKKEGLFRKNMMGKRVNFAARSVISPDPYISGGEIGVPPYFAKKLSFPERVTPYNVEELRQMVINGPEVWPGAVAVEDEAGRLINLCLPTYKDKAKREAVAKILLSAPKSQGPGGAPLKNPSKVVYRHLRDGDLMLTNRQPTLHKPGLMAHRARVLKGERTIRMHYSNCSTFNADFDGDEINLHLPQDQFCRAEGYNIVHADHQYIVPTDGKPIRGLIQDHIVAGTLLTKRDTFLNKRDFMQLVYAAVAPTRKSTRKEAQIEVPPPTILKPVPLWTGKQVVTCILKFLSKGLPPITLECGGKVPAAYMGADGAEGTLVVDKGELITGVIDKNQFAKYGLVHGFQELYGGDAAGRLLASFSRVFTYFLQVHGFTCGMDDVLLVGAAEDLRKRLLKKSEGLAVSASCQYAGLTPIDDADKENKALVLSRERDVLPMLADMYRSDVKTTGVQHDMKVSGVMHPLSSEVIKQCIPAGQLKSFFKNCMALMTVTGAKGSIVNFSQISCLLGQQELEGRRSPRMASGKTLPCFRAYDAGARAGGFIGDRFLTGLRPQEYYFHCMAGRDGLVDTAVKTARSGYLQRCLVKNLESLKVHYDATVRDDADGSVVQFMYGEDGIDVMQVSHLTRFNFLARNAERLAQSLDLASAQRAAAGAGLGEMEGRARAAIEARAAGLRKALDKGQDPRKKLNSGNCPLSAEFPPSVAGVTSEAFMDALTDFIRREEASQSSALTSTSYAKKDKKKGGDGVAPAAFDPRSPEGFRRLMELKFLGSMAAAGEAVGVIAAQSVGEPSTQMTLNTFHMAGRGEANVTLGIPRLRELFMTAAKRIATPVMRLPLKEGCGQAEAQKLVASLRKLRLAECLKALEVEEVPVSAPSGTALSGRARVYRVMLQFYPDRQYPAEAGITFQDLVRSFKTEFLPRLKAAVKLELKRLNSKLGMGLVKESPMDALGEGAYRRRANANGDEDEDAPRKKGADRAYDNEHDNEDFVDEDENAEENPEYREGRDQWKGRGEDRVGYEDDEEERRPGNDDADEDLFDEEAEVARLEASAANAASGVDTKRHRCYAEVLLELSQPKLLMLEIAERVAAAAMVKHTAGINKCYILEGKDGGPPVVQTDGLNFLSAWQNQDVVDAGNVLTNDVGAVLDTYGVEAARATLVHEVRSVFGAYGIGVDPRHLGLIADFMTFNGGYRACNRLGIESSASPFLKMSFETATHFLTDAVMRGSHDDMSTPASRIVMGRPVALGTGACAILQQLEY